MFSILMIGDVFHDKSCVASQNGGVHLKASGNWRYLSSLPVVFGKHTDKKTKHCQWKRK
jgi:hypothetical protein